jgi:MFS family permease
MAGAALQGTASRSGRRRAALALLCVAQFVDVLGVTIVIVALPAIGRDLGLGEQSLQWVASIYALCFGGFLLLAGRAADLYGRRRLFAIGLALFTLACLACALATSPVLLVPSRRRCRCSPPPSPRVPRAPAPWVSGRPRRRAAASPGSSWAGC